MNAWRSGIWASATSPAMPRAWRNTSPPSTEAAKALTAARKGVPAGRRAMSAPVTPAAKA